MWKYFSARKQTLWDGILLIGGLSIFIAELFIFTNHEHGFSGFLVFILLVFLPAIGILFLVAPFLLSKQMRQRLVLVFISSVFTIYAMESAFSFIRPKDLFEQMAGKSGMPFDRRSVFKFIQDEATKGHVVYPRLGGAHFLDQPIFIGDRPVVPLGGVASVTTVARYETGTFLVYRSDEHGFLNPSGLWSKEALDIVAVGDSFTLGCSVGLEENYMALIRQHYPNTLNLGQGGNGPLLMLACVKEYATHFKPATVCWFYFEGNDLEDLNHEKENPLLIQYLEQNHQQELAQNQNLLDDALKQYIAHSARGFSKDRYKQGLINFVKLRSFRERTGLLFKPPTDMDLFAQVLTNAKKTIQGWNGKFLFVYLPCWERYSGYDVAKLHREEVLKMVKGLQIPVVDMDQVFRLHQDPLSFYPYRLNGHYNAEGHRAVAEAVISCIQLDQQYK